MVGIVGSNNVVHVADKLRQRLGLAQVVPVVLLLHQLAVAVQEKGLEHGRELSEAAKTRGRGEGAVWGAGGAPPPPPLPGTRHRTGTKKGTSNTPCRLHRAIAVHHPKNVSEEMRREEGSGGLGPKVLCTIKGPIRFSQRYISFFPTMVPLVWKGGGGGAARMVVSRSSTSLHAGTTQFLLKLCPPQKNHLESNLRAGPRDFIALGKAPRRENNPILENSQVPLNSLNSSNSGAFGRSTTRAAFA